VDIALSKVISPERLGAYLARLLPGAAVDVRTSDSSESWRDCDVAMTIVDNPSEFPCGLCVGVNLTDASRVEDWLRELARLLSIEFECRVVCDGSPFGDDQSPYWVIVWDAGEPYLGDDVHSLLGDGEGGSVRIVRPLGGTIRQAGPVLNELVHRVAR
jgi:hypothetical protein